MFTIREVTPDDPPALLALLNGVWHGDEAAVAYHRRGRMPGLVAELDGVPVGYAHAGKSSLHPTHTYVGVHVHPQHRARGIGTALWKALEPRLSGSLKTATYATQTAALPFLQQRGFRLSVETHQPSLNPQNLDPAQVQAWVAEAEALGYELLPMSKLNGPDVRRKLAQLHLDVYAHTHEHDPPALGTPEDAEDDFLGDDLNPAWLWVALKDGELVGVSSVRLTADPRHGELGWFGVAKAFAAAGASLTRALTGLALQSAANNGLTHVEAELDSPDPNALHLLRQLPWQAGKVWLTFIRSE